jgi:hypothetical protein
VKLSLPTNSEPGDAYASKLGRMGRGAATEQGPSRGGILFGASRPGVAGRRPPPRAEISPLPRKQLVAAINSGSIDVLYNATGRFLRQRTVEEWCDIAHDCTPTAALNLPQAEFLPTQILLIQNAWDSGLRRANLEPEIGVYLADEFGMQIEPEPRSDMG